MSADGGVRFHAYVDAGVAAEPSNALVIRLLEAKSGKVVDNGWVKISPSFRKAHSTTTFPISNCMWGNSAS